MAGREGVLMSFGCMYPHATNHHCSSKRCQCECHTPRSLLETYREDAHAAVKAFDHKPSPETASAAIAALSLFIGVHNA